MPGVATARCAYPVDRAGSPSVTSRVNVLRPTWRRRTTAGLLHLQPDSAPVCTGRSSAGRGRRQVGGADQGLPPGCVGAYRRGEGWPDRTPSAGSRRPTSDPAQSQPPYRLAAVLPNPPSVPAGAARGPATESCRLSASSLRSSMSSPSGCSQPRDRPDGPCAAFRPARPLSPIRPGVCGDPGTSRRGENMMTNAKVLQAASSRVSNVWGP